MCCRPTRPSASSREPRSSSTDSASKSQGSWTEVRASFGTIDLGSNPATVLTVGQNGVFKQPISFQGQIVGQGDLVFTGLGSQWMGGTSSYLGTTTVRQGIVELRAPVPGQRQRPARQLGRRRDPPRRRELRRPQCRAHESPTSLPTGFARPITVVAGAGNRTIGHRLHGATHDGSTVTFSGPIALEKDLVLYSLTTRDYVGSDLRVSGVVSGTGGLVKIGGGEARLTADNTYTGATTIQNGRLILRSGRPRPPVRAAGSSSAPTGAIPASRWTLAQPRPHRPELRRVPDPGLLPECQPHRRRGRDPRPGPVRATAGRTRAHPRSRSATSSSSASANTLELVTPVTRQHHLGDAQMTGGLDRQNRQHAPRHLAGRPGQPRWRRTSPAFWRRARPALVGGGGAAGIDQHQHHAVGLPRHRPRRYRDHDRNLPHLRPNRPAAA